MQFIYFQSFKCRFTELSFSVCLDWLLLSKHTAILVCFHAFYFVWIVGASCQVFSYHINLMLNHSSAKKKFQMHLSPSPFCSPFTKRPPFREPQSGSVWHILIQRCITKEIDNIHCAHPPGLVFQHEILYSI